MTGSRLTAGMIVALVLCACGDDSRIMSPVTDVGPAFTTGNDWVEAVTGAAHAFGTLNGAPFPRNLQFNARRASDGTVTGHLTLLTGIVKWYGPVLCFVILDENRVRIGSLAETIIDPKGILFENPPQGVLEIFAIVADNGEGAGDDEDRVSSMLIGGPGTAATGCDGGFDGIPDVELSSGNVQVHRR